MSSKSIYSLLEFWTFNNIASHSLNRILSYGLYKEKFAHDFM